jgi:hypothetical protein
MTTDLVPLEGIDITETGWQPARALTFAEWREAGDQLLRVGRAWQWWVGDWILYGEHHHEDRYADVVEQTGYEYATISHVISVARRVEASRRRDELSWSHHAEVAPLEPEQQVEWLQKAVDEDLTLARFRTVLREVKGTREPKVPPAELATTAYRVEFVGLVHAETAADALERVRVLSNRLAAGGMDVTEKSMGVMENGVGEA